MKYRTTEKALRNGYNKIICVGYGSLQFLLYYKTPIAYTCGTYGWNADVYEIDGGTAICTGYRPIGNIRPSYELVRKYDKQAEKIVYASGEYNEKKQKLDEMLRDFIGDVFKEYDETHNRRAKK